MSKFRPGTIGEIVNCDFVLVRSLDENGDYIKVQGNKLKVGSTVELLEYIQSAGRYRIEYDGHDGYIYKDYVKLL